MNLLYRFRDVTLSHLPCNILLLLESIEHNPENKWFIQGIRLKKFAKSLNLTELSNDRRESRSIEAVEWNYPLFQVCFLEDVVAECLDCLSKGFLPYVNYKTSNNVNLWTQFCEQPCSGSAEGKWPLKKANFRLPAFPTPDDVELFHGVYQVLVRYNDTTQAYFDQEFQSIFVSGRKILGVLCRGTDYVANKPKWHPVQPSVDEVIELAKMKIDEYGFTHIYLATEEESIFHRFDNAFPGRILTNKRKYYDSFYEIKKEKKDAARISQVHFERDDDAYYKSLEYLSSLNLLSKCDGLIAGSTGGSRLALVMNDNRYEFSYLFNKGFY